MSELLRIVKRQIQTLTEREQQVLGLRFGIEDGYCYTLKQCGIKLGISAGRCLQIEQKAIRKMRHPTRTSEIEYDLSHTTIAK